MQTVTECCTFARGQMGQIIYVDSNVSSSPDPPILTAQAGSDVTVD